jgi:hypothetical protein
LLEIEHDGALVAVVVEEDVSHAGVPHGCDVTQNIPLGRFDLDDIRPEVGEDLGRERSHHHRGEVDDAYAGERTAHSVAITA